MSISEAEQAHAVEWFERFRAAPQNLALAPSQGAFMYLCATDYVELTEQLDEVLPGSGTLPFAVADSVLTLLAFQAPRLGAALYAVAVAAEAPRGSEAHEQVSVEALHRASVEMNGDDTDFGRAHTACVCQLPGLHGIVALAAGTACQKLEEEHPELGEAGEAILGLVADRVLYGMSLEFFLRRTLLADVPARAVDACGRSCSWPRGDERRRPGEPLM